MFNNLFNCLRKFCNLYKLYLFLKFLCLFTFIVYICICLSKQAVILFILTFKVYKSVKQLRRSELNFHHTFIVACTKLESWKIKIFTEVMRICSLTDHYLLQSECLFSTKMYKSIKEGNVVRGHKMSGIQVH